MKVTPSDIRKKEFKRSVRGYAEEEVDLFLDEIADELERLGKETADLQERARRGDEQFVGHQQLKDALEKTLVSAQIQADENRAAAQRDSESILRQAELKARGIVGESYGEVQKVQQSLVQLKQLEEEFRTKFQSLLEGYMRLLAEAPAAMPTVPAAAMQVAPEPEPAPLPPQAFVAVPASADAVPAGSPFVVPAAFEEVPEYPAVATPPRLEPEAPVAAPSAAMAPPVPKKLDSFLNETPAVFRQPVAEPALPAALLWPDDSTADHAGDETVTLDQAPAYAPDRTGSLYPGREGAGPGPVDDSVTLVRDEDPLRGFFFGAKDDGTADGMLDGGKGGKNPPRDFEW